MQSLQRWSLLILLAAAAGCAKSTEEPKILSMPAVSLIGEWQRQSELNHRPRLWIDSAVVTFETEVDTIFRYAYTRRGDTLELEEMNGTVVNVHIVRLEPDSLILDGLPFAPVSARYWRTGR